MAAQGQNDRQQGVHSLLSRVSGAAHRPRGEGGGSGGGEGEVQAIISDHNWRLEKEKAMTDGPVEPGSCVLNLRNITKHSQMC